LRRPTRTTRPGLTVDGDAAGKDPRIIKKSGKVQVLKDAIFRTRPAEQQPVRVGPTPAHYCRSGGIARAVAGRQRTRR